MNTCDLDKHQHSRMARLAFGVITLHDYNLPPFVHLHPSNDAYATVITSHYGRRTFDLVLVILIFYLLGMQIFTLHYLGSC